MGQGYIRNDGANNIANGNVIDAADLDGEFDALVDAFAAATGHTHDGTAAEGGAVLVIGPAQEFVGDGLALAPKTDNTYDLGKADKSFKKIYVEAIDLGGVSLTAVEQNADVTDETNVQAAGALMDTEVTNLAAVKAFDTTDYATATQGSTADAALPKAGGALTGAVTTNSTFDTRNVGTDGDKLDNIESNADVTDTLNVTAAGALMDTEVDADIKTLSLPANTTISVYGASLVDDADAAASRSTLGLGTVATTAATAYATATQGTTADNALPKAGGTMTGDLEISNGTPEIKLTDTGGTDEFTTIVNDSGSTVFTGQNVTANGQFIFKQNDGTTLTEAMRISANGRLGIGITAPTKTLDVSGNGGFSGDLHVGDDIFMASSTPKIQLSDTDVTSAFTDIAQSGGSLFIAARSGDDNGQIVFRRRAGDVTTESARFDENGYLGIGLANPTLALDVFGNARVSGTTPDIRLFETDANSGAGVGHRLVASGGQLFVQARAQNGNNAGGTINVTGMNSTDLGLFRVNATASEFNGSVDAVSYTGDGSSLTGIDAGAKGGGNDKIFYENGQTITTNYTVLAAVNAMTAGPVSVNAGVTVTVETGSRWVVV